MVAMPVIMLMLVIVVMLVIMRVPLCQPRLRLAVSLNEHLDDLA